MPATDQASAGRLAKWSPPAGPKKVAGGGIPVFATSARAYPWLCGLPRGWGFRVTTRNILAWEPPGPVSARFMASTAPAQVLNGPIGSGKTTTCLMKGVRLAAGQAPAHQARMRGPGGSLLPVRQFRLTVVRDTYRQLWKTTLPSWWLRVPRTVGEFTGAENAPAKHVVPFALSDGTMVDLQVDFVAIGDNSAEDVLRGYQSTAFYLNEADLLAREVFTFARGRTGRFPEMSEGGPTWHGILMDCNAPELGGWLHDDIFAASPAVLAEMGIELFRQPSGLSEDAENVQNLPPGYYRGQVAGQPDWYVQRMIHNRPGYSRAGKPVFPEFDDNEHVTPRELELMPHAPLLIGLDAGLSPAAVFAQRGAEGQWRIIDELVGDQGTGARRFGEALAQRLHERYADAPQVTAWADPSAAYGADRQAGEQSWIEIVEARAGIAVRAAPTNALIPRLEAVRLPLMRRRGFLLSPRCTVLRQGFNAGYRYRKIAGQEEDRYAEEIEKNRFSHPQDALQYVLSAGGEDLLIRDRQETRRAALRAPIRREDHDWDAFSR
jgi:hypothetical protein